MLTLLRRRCHSQLLSAAVRWLCSRRWNSLMPLDVYSGNNKCRLIVLIDLWVTFAVEVTLLFIDTAYCMLITNSGYCSIPGSEMNNDSYKMWSYVVKISRQLDFYSASALLAMQTAVIATSCLSVRPSVTFPCFVQKNEDTIVRFSASSMIIILISGEVKFFFGYSQGIPQRGRWSEALPCH